MEFRTNVIHLEGRYRNSLLSVWERLSTALTHARLAGDLFSGRHLVKLVNLARSLADFVEETPREFHRLILSRGFEQRVAADDLFRLGKRTVGDRDLAAGALVHANASRAENARPRLR